MIKNQILCLGLSRVELQTLYVRFPILYQFYQVQSEDFDDIQKIKMMVSESVCLFINPKKLNGLQLSNLIREYEYAAANTHAAILLFTSAFTKEQRYEVDTEVLRRVDLKARFDKTLRDAVEFVRKASMPCWDGLKRMEANMFNDGWYLLDLTSTGLDPTSDEVIAITIAFMGQYELREKETIYIKPSRPLTEEDEAITGITNEMLEDGMSKEDAVSYLENLPHPAPFIIETEKYDYPALKALYHFCGKKFDHPYVAIDGLAAIAFGYKLLRRSSDLVKAVSDRMQLYIPEDERYIAELYALTVAVFENLRDRYAVRCPGQFKSLYFGEIHCCD